jgi:hypothetical protein
MTKMTIDIIMILGSEGMMAIIMMIIYMMLIRMALKTMMKKQ